MILLSLAHQRESRVRSLVKGNVIDAVRALVVSRDYVLSNDSIEQLTLVLTASSLVVLPDGAHPVKDSLCATDYFVNGCNLQEDALFSQSELRSMARPDVNTENVVLHNLTCVEQSCSNSLVA